MKRKPGKPKPPQRNQDSASNAGGKDRAGNTPAPRLNTLAVMSLAAAVLIAALLWLDPWKSIAPERYVPRPPGQLTFTKDVAPIILEHCARCHRPGQSAPFNLLRFEEVKKRSREIADVTARRYMPPWLPEHGYGEFAGERRLTIDQLGILQQWLAEGAIEGQKSNMPPLPQWSGDWQLGPPDLVVTMPQSYTLAAECLDVNRNFVIP